MKSLRKCSTCGYVRAKCVCYSEPTPTVPMREDEAVVRVDARELTADEIHDEHCQQQAEVVSLLTLNGTQTSTGCEARGHVWNNYNAEYSLECVVCGAKPTEPAALHDSWEQFEEWWSKPLEIDYLAPQMGKEVAFAAWQASRAGVATATLQKALEVVKNLQSPRIWRTKAESAIQTLIDEVK